MTPSPTPRYYILHGEDELACKEALQGLQSRLGPPELSALNTTVFDGAGVTLTELTNTCDTIPFMAERRMVVVHGLLSRLMAQREKKTDQGGGQGRFVEGLRAYLAQLPDSTRLIFVEPAELPKNHPILTYAQSDPLAYVRAFPRPKDMVQWVRRRAADKGGSLTPQAAVHLVQAVGEEQRLLDQEIDKLLAYVNRARPVTLEDVTSLVPYAQEAVIFEAVDALGQRDGVKAAQLLHNLMDHNNDPRYLLAMIVRQFRLLIQVKELDEEGLDTAAISKRIQLHPFPTGKLHSQARNFTMEQLERVHRRLLEIDLETKTGQMDEVVALDLLIAGLAPPK